jgi:hypothetical protein
MDFFYIKSLNNIIMLIYKNEDSICLHRQYLPEFYGRAHIQEEIR